MVKTKAGLAIFFLGSFLTFSWGFQLEGAEGSGPGTVRDPVLAGTWYPGNPEELKRSVNGYLARAEVAGPSGDLRGLIVPHAGYMYSGQVAAFAYRLLKGSEFRRVILIGPSHRVSFKAASVDLSSGYRTPLGVMPVDADFGKRLLDHSPVITSVPAAHVQEHSLEIQVPFLQTVLPEAQIVPLVMGQQDFAFCESLASALIREIGSDRRTLVLASTDLSHRHVDAEARKLDKEFIRQVQAFDPRGLARSIAEGRSEACGGGGAVVAIIVCRALHADSTLELRHATSGDITGDRREVVGYLSAALLKSRQ